MFFYTINRSVRKGGGESKRWYGVAIDFGGASPLLVHSTGLSGALQHLSNNTDWQYLTQGDSFEIGFIIISPKPRFAYTYLEGTC